MRWLITGGCGFIGVNLVERLLADEKNQVIVLDNLSVGSREDLAAVTEFEEINANTVPKHSVARVILCVGDILDEGAVMAASEGADIVVHLAANTGVGPSVDDPRHDCVANIIGTLNVLEAARARGCKRVVFASSGAPVGECEPPIHEELAPHPVSPYGASKLAGEGYCSAYFRTFGLPTVALRFGNVYGPRSAHKSSVVARFIRQAHAGDILEIYGDGEQTRDFIFIDDLNSAILCAATAEDVGGEVFQIATHRETSVNELAAELRNRLLEKRPGISFEIRNSEPRLGDVRRNYSDTTKAKHRLGWEADYSLAEGLEKTVDWFLAQNESGR